MGLRKKNTGPSEGQLLNFCEKYGLNYHNSEQKEEALRLWKIAQTQRAKEAAAEAEAEAEKKEGRRQDRKAKRRKISRNAKKIGNVAILVAYLAILAILGVKIGWQKAFTAGTAIGWISLTICLVFEDTDEWLALLISFMFILFIVIFLI